jgi:hypothetical protein
MKSLDAVKDSTMSPLQPASKRKDLACAVPRWGRRFDIVACERRTRRNQGADREYSDAEQWRGSPNYSR